MAQEKADLKTAKSVYKTLCRALDAKDIMYRKSEDDLRFDFGVKGTDMSMDVKIKVHPDRRLILFLSKVPIEVDEKRRIAVAAAVNRVNYAMLDGSFDYCHKNGEIIFRMSLNYCGCEVKAEMIDYFLGCSFGMIDKLDVEFATVAKSDMTIDRAIEYIGTKVGS